MKILKQKMSKEGILQEVKRRRFYEKPSVKRKRKTREARKRRRREAKRKSTPKQPHPRTRRPPPRRSWSGPPRPPGPSSSKIVLRCDGLALCRVFTRITPGSTFSPKVPRKR